MSPLEVPQRFARAILVHLLRVYAADLYPDAALILGIHGPAGEGKTLQLDTLLHACGVQTFRLSGGQFEDRLSGEPARRLRDTYLQASDHLRQEGPAAVVVNDIDTGIGDFGNLVQYTVNRQNVAGELMSLADGPETVEGRSIVRVPIIVTANDLTKLYAPLLRLGRMVPYFWQPSAEEKAGIVARIYPGLRDNEISALVNEYRDQPVAFFAQLGMAAGDAAIWDYVQHRGFTAALHEARRGKVRFRSEVTLEALREAADNLLQRQEDLSNYVQGATA